VRPADEKPAEKLFTFWSVGWVICLSVLGVCIILGMTIYRLAEERAARIGDGKNVDTYQFDLDTVLVGRDEIVASGMYRDKVKAFIEPAVWSVEQHDAKMNRRGKTFLLKGDRVIGVTTDGQARAYPIMILNWHEVANDTLGGRKIAVTYHPLTEGVAVFDREVGGETLTFGVSGLLWQSSQLLYERRASIGTESLWSQLQARAVAGPKAAAGEKLTPVPFELVTWGTWKERHPTTTILAPDDVMLREYKRRPYASYFGRRMPREEFPVRPYPPPGGEDLAWERVAVLADGSLTLYGSDSPKAVGHAFWWSWFATHPDTALIPQ
jgi:hypothetical protein